MSTAATAAVMRAAGALPPGPALVFDLGIVRDRMDRARAAARAAGVELLHAVKAFPAPVAVELAATHLDGLDVAGPEEQAAALAVAPTTVSVTWPGDVDAAALTALAARHRVTAVCETAAQLATAAKVAGVTLAVRLASDADSRFGVAPEALREVVAVAAGRVRALHVHGGPLATSPGTIAARARRACDAADAAGLALAQLDLGGSLHGFAITSATSGQALVADAFAAARAVVPTGVRLLFEPGRLWTEGAGFAVGIAIRDVIDAIVLDSRRILPVSTVQDGKCYGIRDVAISVPTVVGRSGAVARLEIELWPKELQGMRNSANVLRQTLVTVLDRVGRVGR